MTIPAAQTILTSLAYEQFVLLKETNIGEEEAFKSAVANMSIEEFFSIKANRGEKEIELNRQFQCVAANMGSLVIPDKASKSPGKASKPKSTSVTTTTTFDKSEKRSILKDIGESRYRHFLNYVKRNNINRMARHFNIEKDEYSIKIR